MRKLFILFGFLLLAPLSALANQNAQGWCEVGAQPVVTSGLLSTTKVQASYPACTVTIFIHGGGTATIFSDNNGTPLANPFTAMTNGHWQFYAANGHYDVQLSGAGFPSPVTISDVILADPANQQAALPCSTLAFSSSLSINATNNVCYETTLTGNVTSSTITGTPASGNLLTLHICQDATGGRTFSFPGNFLTPNSIQTAPNLCTDETFYYDGTNWSLLIQPSGGTAVCTSFANSLLSFGCDLSFLGPNPAVSITFYNARAVNPNTTPATVGLTANCSSGLSTVPISSASTFRNGDGVVLYGCGAAHSMTTPGAPTVTPSLAKTGTGTGLVVNGPTGATTFNYQIVAQDKNGGLTAASATGSTTTGAASLGAQTVNITSMSRANDVVTVTTAAAHGFTVGCTIATCGEVFIGGGNSESDPTFRGWYLVSSAADSTHFTIANFPLDTRNGATTSATGGTATYYNCNHLTWSAVTGAWKYYIYSDRANPGTFALVGVSRPQGATNTDLTWDDFGSPMMDNFSFPPFVPTAPPSSATSDHLSTTISSGAGTTTLTLANAAGTTITGATIRIDAAPGILAAATAASANGFHGGTVLIPATSNFNTFVVNSYLNLSSLNIAISQAGPMQLNETVETKAKWYGDRVPQYGNSTLAGTWQGNSTIAVGTANPGVYNPQIGGAVLQGVSLAGSTNGSLLALYEGGFNMAFLADSFVTSNAAGDYMGIGLYLRGSTGQSATNVIIDRTLFSTGGGLIDGASHTPAWICNLCGQGQVRSAYYLHRGAIVNLVAAGGSWDIQHSYINGGINPLYTITGGANNWTASLGQITLDTFAHPALTSFSYGFILFPLGGSNATAASGVPFLSGLRNPVFGATSLSGSATFQNRDSQGPICQFGALDGIFGSAGRSYCVNANNAALATGTNYPIFVNGVAPAQPTCSVSAGGSLAVGTYAFALAAIWQNGGEGTYSPVSSSCTTTTGNQTITINYAAPVGNPKSLNLYYCIANANGCTSGLAASNTFGDPLSPSSTSFVWTSSSFNSFASPGSAVPSGGPTMLGPGVQGAFAPQYVFNAPGGFASTWSPTTFTANRSVTVPNATGTAMLYSGSFANNDCVSASVSAGVTTFVTAGAACGSGGGGGPTIQTNGVNNSLQTTLNFITSSANTTGLTLTPSNPSGGSERFEATGTVNAASGGTGLSSPAAHSLLVAEGSSPFNVVTSPTVNGFYNCGFNVIASATVDPTCPLPGVNVVKPTTPYTMTFSDRFTYQFWSAGTTATSNLPQIIGGTASNFGFLAHNTNTGTLTLTANAADDIDGGSLGGSATVLTNMAAFLYSESATGPGHWHTMKLPTYAAFPPTLFGNFAAHQFLGNGTASSAIPAATLIGASDTTTNIYSADTGAVNAYVVNPSPAVTALTVGTIITFTTANANTGASTINVSSLGVKNITKSGGTALASGDIKANAPIMIEYDTALGTPGWELVSGAGGAATGTVTSVDGSAGVGVQTIQSSAVGAITTSGTVQGSDLVNSQTGTSYTIVTGDRGHVIVQTNAAAIADTLPQATAGAASNFAPGWYTEVFNTGGTNVTITPTTSTINGKTSLVVPGGTWVKIISDGTNYDALVENGAPSKVNLTAVTAQAAVTTDQALQELSLPAGYLNVLSQPYWIHGSGIYTIAVAQTPTLTYKIKLCTVSGCGSGTVVTLASITTGATVTLTNNNWNLGVLAATNTTGATGNFLVHGAPGLTVDLAATAGGADTVYGDTNTAVSSSIDLTAALFVDFTVATSTGNAGNQITEQIEAVMPQSNPTGSTAIAAPGSNKQLLYNNNGSIAAEDYYEHLIVPAANCNNATAGTGWSIGSGGTATCRAGTNNLGGFVSITDTSSTFAQFTLALPEDWDTTINPYIRFQIASTDTTSGHTIIPQIKVSCAKGDGTTTDDVAFNAAHSLSTVTLNTTANQFWSSSNVQMNSTDMTGCVAGALMIVQVGRATDTATNAEFYSATVTIPRLITAQAN